MRIEIQVEIDITTREAYVFNLFDNLKLVFVGYFKEIKPKGKRKWTTEKFWDKYSRNSNIDEPVLNDEIKEQVLLKAQSQIKVLTWKEYKNE